MEQKISVPHGTLCYGLLVIWPLCILWYARDLIFTRDPAEMLDISIFLICILCLMLHTVLIRRQGLILGPDMLRYRGMFSGWELAKYRISSATVQEGRTGKTIVLTDRTSGRTYAFPERLLHDDGVKAWFSDFPDTFFTTPENSAG